MLRLNPRSIDQLAERLYFSGADLVRLLGIKPASARVLSTRYVRRGMFIRLKRDFYVLAQNWRRYTTEEQFKLANLLQVPSYISFLTALRHHGITTQVPRGYIESAALKRTVEYTVRDKLFVYHKIKPEYYFDFQRPEGIFFSTKEKALVDAVYLTSVGRYALDLDALDLTKMDPRRIRRIIAAFPGRTARIVRGLCKI